MKLIPRIEPGTVRPFGFSIGIHGLVLLLPLLFRWRKYSYEYDCEMWGSAVIFITNISKKGFFICWRPDREGPTSDDYRMNNEQ